MLGSGFWLIATERFDPRTAKRRFGQIAGAGTLGGLLGGLLAERVAAVMGLTATLPLLALLNVVCAWQVRRLATQTDLADPPRSRDVRPVTHEEPSRSGLDVLTGSPYLKLLADAPFRGAFGLFGVLPGVLWEQEAAGSNTVAPSLSVGGKAFLLGSSTRFSWVAVSAA